MDGFSSVEKAFCRKDLRGKVYVGTAAFGCPVERSSTGFWASKIELRPVRDKRLSLLRGQNPPFHRHRQSLARRSQDQSRRPSAILHQIRHCPLRIELRRLPQQPPEPLLHHVVLIAEQRIG